MTKTEIQKADNTKPVPFSKWIEQPFIQSRIQTMVKGERGNRFMTAVIAAVAINPDLALCDPNTILSSALVGESLQLSPSPQIGQFYLVPFNNKTKGIKEAQFIIGYKGYIQLAIRSGQYKNIGVGTVKKGELISWNPLTEDLKVKFIEDEDERDEAETIGYYCRFQLLNGFEKTLYWTIKRMERHADKYVPTFDLIKYNKVLAGEKFADDWKFKNGFWVKDFDSQGMKTMIRQTISKWGVMSIEMQNAYDMDTESMKNVDSPETPNEELTTQENEIDSALFGGIENK